MDLRDQLESTLGHTYSIERELGGGGMSRVFAATETALGRKVVIKVVPLELGADVNADRFKREILLAANLQHPHIVPVLTAGETAGVPYYTMPFIEGESLRARLERGPVAIGDAVSILRDVARALAYAHERGVVHRDIKPDNVLLSGGSATVTDFGIAKALVAASAPAKAGQTTESLTVLGTSIGTPAYMAPEQAAADPSTDHRADIYSFGCLAYELLAGRPPFSGLSPHKLLTAQMSERPKPVAQLRPDTPPLLADLVAQCLEKDPDARPQSAGDVVRILEAVGTGTISGSVAIAMAGPGSLKRALGIYAVTFASVVILAKAAAVGIGVPDWVMPTTIGLMLVALPLILATGYVQRVARKTLIATPRGATPAPGTTVATLALKASPYLSWRHVGRSIASAIISFALLVTVLMGLRPLGLGPLASLMASGTLHARDKVLVADFTSTGADTTLGGVVSEAVRADLGQSPVVSVVTPQTVAAALERMQQPANTRIDTAVARRIAQREGIKAVVGGEVHSIAGGGFLLTMKLLRADSGQVLASLTESADSPKDLIPAIGKMTRKLRGRMGESLKHVQASAELAQVTTSSLEALQKYTEGQRAMSVEANLDKAIPLFRQAVAIDTGFASAYRALAIALGNRGQDREGQIRAVEKAYAHSTRLPEVERYLAIAAYWSQGPRPDRAKAAATYESLLTVRPNNYAALNNLALTYAQDRNFGKAIELLRRAIDANPTTLVAYGNLMGYQAEQGQIAPMESTFTKELRASGNNPRVAIGRTSILFSRGDYDSVNALVDSIVQANPGDDGLARQRSNIRQVTALTTGKLTESLRLASVNAATAMTAGEPGAALGASFDSAMVEAWFRGSKDKALAITNAALKRTPLGSLKPGDRPYVNLAMLYALEGRPDLSRAMLSEFEATASTMAPDVAAGVRHSLMAAIALAEHRYADASREARASDVGTCTTCVLPLLALTYDYADQPDSAIAVYTRYVESTSILNRFGNDGFFLAGAYKRLGELLEAKGDRTKAARYYTRFVAMWKDADPDLQRSVADVRKKLTRLSDTEAKP